MISLIPPRNPHSTKAEDRRWHIVEVKGCIAQYTQVYGASSVDPQAAKAEANRLLGKKYTWLKKGQGFQARIPKGATS